MATRTNRRTSKTSPKKRAGTRPSQSARAATARLAEAPPRGGVRRAEDKAPSAHDHLVATLAALNVASSKLLAIDQTALSDEDFKLWADEVNQVDLAIARTRNSLLGGIADEFEAALPAIQQSTGRLKADLEKVNEAVAVINLVAGALGVIEQIIRLGL